MKILYHHRTLGDGAEGIHISEMVKAFRNLGHDVHIVSLIGDSTNVRSHAQRRWSRVARLLPGFTYELSEMVYNLPGYAALSKAVKIFSPDFIYDRYVSYSYAAVGLGQHLEIPVILEVNSPYSYQKQTFDESLHFARLLRFFERKTCRDASRVIVVSTPLKHFLVSIGVPNDHIVVMPNGVDPESFHPALNGAEIRKELGLDDRIIVGFTGILRPWHGLDLLIDAFQRVAQAYHNIHLLIVGDGPIRQNLERLLFEKRLSTRATITGRVPHERVRLYIAAMDIAVSPRATFYASPMKILEYMAMGKPVIAPDMENIRDIITHQKDGVLFRPEDSDKLAEGLRSLIADVTLRSRLGLVARKKIETERTWEHNARAVIDLIGQSRQPRPALT